MKRVLVLFFFIASFHSSHALTLDAVLRTTVEKNPEIVRARHALEQAAGRRLVLRAIGLPDAVIGVVGGDQGGHRAGEKTNQPFGFGYGGLTQPFFNAAIPASYRRANLEVLIAQQQLNIAVTTQVHNARMAFYSALYNQNLSRIRGERRQRLEQNAASQNQRYQSGLVDRGMFVGAEVQTRALDPEVEASKRGYAGSLLKLAEAMGEDLGPSARLPEPAGELKFVPVEVNLQTETARVLRQRADLQLGRLLLQASNEDQRIMEAAYYPIINATVSGEYIPVSGVRGLQSQGSPRRSDDIISSEVRAGGSYTWRVIDNGQTYGAVLKARSAREINEILLQKMEADTARELARIQENFHAISAKYALLSKASGAAAENAVNVQENLAGGIVSQLDFRLAQNAALEIQTGMLNLSYQENMARAEWDRATGRYLQFSAESRQNVQ